MPGDDASDPDLRVPDEIPDVRTEPAPDGHWHGSGRSKARAQVPRPIPVDILLRATGPFRQNTDIENFVNDVASHYDVSDNAQAPGVRTEVLRAGMKRSASMMLAGRPGAVSGPGPSMSVPLNVRATDI